MNANKLIACSTLGIARENVVSAICTVEKVYTEAEEHLSRGYGDNISMAIRTIKAMCTIIGNEIDTLKLSAHNEEGAAETEEMIIGAAQFKSGMFND